MTSIRLLGADMAEIAAPFGIVHDEASDLFLCMTDDGLALGGDTAVYGHPVTVDFVGGRVGHRRQFGGGRGQLVARACGLTKGVTPSIVDATAGLGRDSFVLASLGAHVLLIERVGPIAALLQDGLERARHAGGEVAHIVERMQLRYGDAASALADMVTASAFAPEVIHLDPMFPHRDKSALVKKEMRLFRTLAGSDDDAPRLLEAALDVATYRVAVKRPKGAPPIAGPAPSHTLLEKNSRYDLYIHRSLSRRD